MSGTNFGPKSVAIAGLVAGLIAVPFVAYGAVGESHNTVETQATAHRTGAVSTTSTKWKLFPIEGAGVKLPLGSIKGSFSMTFSADIHGARVQFRARDNGTTAFPGKAQFDTRGADTSRSFTFVSDGSAVKKCHSVWVQWRSPSGNTVTVDRADLAVLYHTAGAATTCAG